MLYKYNNLYLLSRKFLPEHAQEIMGYAAKHGYNDLVGETAPLLLAMPWEEALLQLPANLVVPWVRRLNSSIFYQLNMIFLGFISWHLGQSPSPGAILPFGPRIREAGKCPTQQIYRSIRRPALVY